MQTSTKTYTYVQNYKQLHWHRSTYIPTQHKHQRTLNTHNLTYQTYYANTDSYKHSYFPHTVRDWNRLPQSILNSNTIDFFTKQIHMHLSPQHPNTKTHTWFSSLPCTPGSPSPPPTSSVYVCYAPHGCSTHYNTETETGSSVVERLLHNRKDRGSIPWPGKDNLGLSSFTCSPCSPCSE